MFRTAMIPEFRALPADNAPMSKIFTPLISMPVALAGSAILGLLMLAPAAVQAQELNVPSAASESLHSGTSGPTRGMSMDKVEATYGVPAKRIPAVGEPPISRWEYPGFVVYFERNLVIHSVVAPAAS